MLNFFLATLILFHIWDIMLSGGVGENLPASAGDTKMWVQSLGWENSLEKEMPTCFNISFLENSMDKEMGRLQFTGSQRVRHN